MRSTSGERSSPWSAIRTSVTVLHRNDRRETFAHVVSGDLRVFSSDSFDFAYWLTARVTALRKPEDACRHRDCGRVGVAEDLVVVAVVVLHHDLDVDFDLFVVEFSWSPCGRRWFGMQRLLSC